MRLAAIAPVIALIAFCGAAAAQEAAPPVENKTVDENKPRIDKVSCVHEDAPTGSRLGGKKTCHTASEWATIRANSQLDVNTLQERQSFSSQLNAQAMGR